MVISWWFQWKYDGNNDWLIPNIEHHWSTRAGIKDYKTISRLDDPQYIYICIYIYIYHIYIYITGSRILELSIDQNVTSFYLSHYPHPRHDCSLRQTTQVRMEICRRTKFLHLVNVSLQRGGPSLIPKPSPIVGDLRQIFEMPCRFSCSIPKFIITGMMDGINHQTPGGLLLLHKGCRT